MAGTGETNNYINENSSDGTGNEKRLRPYHYRSLGPHNPGHPIGDLYRSLSPAQRTKIESACALGAAVCAGLVATIVAAAAAALAASMMRGGTRKAKKSKRKARATRARKH
jgi:hypothetical protein